MHLVDVSVLPQINKLALNHHLKPGDFSPRFYFAQTLMVGIQSNVFQENSCITT
jgi:hypothetical protein